jgi:hypothetical protein
MRKKAEPFVLPYARFVEAVNVHPIHVAQRTDVPVGMEVGATYVPEGTITVPPEGGRALIAACTVR